MREKLSNIAGGALAFFVLYTSAFGAFEGLIQRAVFLILVIILGFTMYPMFKTPVRHGWAVAAFEAVLGVCSVLACVRVIMNYEHIILNLPAAEPLDIACTAILLLTILELCRRTVGWIFTSIIIAALAYTCFGHLISGPFGHREYDFAFIAEVLYLNDLGIWGSMLAVGAAQVAIFITFGSMLLYTGGGQCLIDFASLVGGKSPGGAAKMATVSSAVFGMMSGNAVGNVATTGNVTIPLMIRLKYPPALAGAVEAVASTGGQLTPPILGAAAFVMAETLGVSYWQIAKAAMLPAILFYLAIYMTVHILAVRTGLAMLTPEETPKISEIFTFKRVLPLLLGIGLLVFGVLRGNSIVYCVFLGVMGLILAYLISNVRDAASFKDALIHLGISLVQTAKGVVLVGILLAGAQILVALINQTGLAVTASTMILGAAGDNLYLMAVITAIICLIMGMGLPTLPAYVLVAAIMCPALGAALKDALPGEFITLGVHGIATHMFVFFYACLSSITPPVCAAVFVASGISKESWLKTAYEAVRLGTVTYILPFMFIFYPGMTWLGGWEAIALAAASGLSLVICVSHIMAGANVTGSRIADAVIFLGIIYLGLLTSPLATYASLALAIGMGMLGKFRYARAKRKLSAVTSN